MRYILHCQLRGDVAEYQRSLVLQIAEKFNLRITKEENLATHFTLKYWFEAENIEGIENLIENFCESHKKTPVKVGGFGGFPPYVVFINVELSEEAKKTFFELIVELRKVSWLSWDQYDGENLHFHSTIAEECNEKYEDVLKFVQGKEKHFDCWFDNITILREISREDNILRWETHKTYSMEDAQ